MSPARGGGSLAIMPSRPGRWNMRVRPKISPEYARPILVIVLGRLAVDKAFQGQHIGAGLLKDALKRALNASQGIGARAAIVHAIDDEAKGFTWNTNSRPFHPIAARYICRSIISRRRFSGCRHCPDPDSDVSAFGHSSRYFCNKSLILLARCIGTIFA